MDAMIVSVARTPIGKAFRGAFNHTSGLHLISPVIEKAVERSGIDRKLVEEIVLGCGYPEATTGGNIARRAGIRAGLPVQSTALTVSRFCASGLEAVAHAARRIRLGEVDVMVAGGIESISMVQPVVQREWYKDKWLREHKPGIYHSMIETANLVAERYNISRQAQDEFSLQSQQRTAAAQSRNIFDDEIVPVFTTKRTAESVKSGEIVLEDVTLSQDEGNRPGTTLDGLSALDPVPGGAFVTAGNASQLSDGGAVCVLMSEREVERLGIEPLAIFRDFAAVGCEPEEMGIGPVFAVPRLLKKNALSVDDIDLWELNEAFASQALYCQQKLGIPNDRLNVNGGAISVGHPFGMTGARMVGHLSLEGRRRKARYGIATMCVAGGMGCAGLLEFI